jgi:hypothetical protein
VIARSAANTRLVRNLKPTSGRYDLLYRDVLSDKLRLKLHQRFNTFIGGRMGA